MLEQFSRYVAYPLWDLKDRSVRLLEHRRLKKFQWCSRAEIEAYQILRLQKIMRHAWNTTEFYPKFWNRNPAEKPIRELRELDEFPILTKRDVQENGAELVSASFARKSLLEARTGGSTGKALVVRFDKRCQQLRNAAALMSDEWAGWRMGMPVAAMWGSPPIPARTRDKLRNAFHDRTFYIDTMNLTVDTLRIFHQRVLKQKSCALFGHAHSIYEYAKFVSDCDEARPAFKAIIATSMMLLPVHKRFIGDVFGIEVSNRYGCEEVGLISADCGFHSGMHVNESHVVVEGISANENAAQSTEVSRLVVTDLNNYGMPMIRYGVGDEGVLTSKPCECGRGLSVISVLVGRTADYLIRRDGSKVSGISIVEKTLTSIAGIGEMQLVQERIDAFRVYMVRSKEYSHATERGLRRSLTEIFGDDVLVDVEVVDSLPKTSRGKSRFAICKV